MGTAIEIRKRCDLQQRDVPSSLHFGRHNDEVQLYTFDALMLDGEELRKFPLSMRKTNLDRLLARRPEGIFIAHLNKERSAHNYSAPRANGA
jgi:ATP-dependent DNA ligase